MNEEIETTGREVDDARERLTGHRREVVLTSPQARSALWGTDDPAKIIERATAAANALAPVLREKGMIQQIGEREHVKIEGWQTLGSLVGVMAVRPWTREVPWPPSSQLTDELRQIQNAGYAFGFDAGYAAQTLGQIEVGGGEGTCRRTESTWNIRGGDVVEDYALKGMALTRAQSRCFASPLRFVVELAGFSGTPAEEMPANAAAGAAPRKGKQGGAATKAQIKFLFGDGNRPGLLSSLNEAALDVVVRHATGGQDALTKQAASKLIERLKDSEDKEAEALKLVEEAGGVQSDLPVDENAKPRGGDDGGVPDDEPPFPTEAEAPQK
jgi:hypothetical protein